MTVALLRECVLRHCMLLGKYRSLPGSRQQEHSFTVNSLCQEMGGRWQNMMSFQKKKKNKKKHVTSAESSYVAKVAPLSIINNFKGKASKYNKGRQLMLIIWFLKVFSSTKGALLMHNQITCWMDVCCKLIFSHGSLNMLEILYSNGICIWNINVLLLSSRKKSQIVKLGKWR